MRLKSCSFKSENSTMSRIPQALQSEVPRQAVSILIGIIGVDFDRFVFLPGHCICSCKRPWLWGPLTKIFAVLIYLKAPNAPDGQTQSLCCFYQMRKVSDNCFAESGTPAMRWSELQISRKKGDSYECQAG
jgi:hypothetical protein